MAERATAGTVRSDLVLPAALPAWSWPLLLAAAGAAYYLAPGTAPSLILLAILAYLVWARVEVAIGLIPLAVPLYMLPKRLHVVRQFDFSLAETAIVLCVAVVAITLLRGQAQRSAGVTLRAYWLPDSPFNAVAALFLVAATLATVFAHFHAVALREYREVVVEPLLFYWLILQRLRGASAAACLGLSVVVSGTLVATMGLIQLGFRPRDLTTTNYYIPGAPVVHLVRAVFGDENALALFLDRALPMALALALFPAWAPTVYALVRSRSDGQAATGLRMPRFGGTAAVQCVLVACAALMGVVIYKSASRGGELAVVICLAVLAVAWQRRRPLLLGAIAVAGVLAALPARHRLENYLSSHGLTTDARQSVWESALHMLRDHPLFGVGPDNFLYYYSNDDACARGHVARWYYNQLNSNGVPVNFDRCISHPHNLILDFWLSSGMLGLLAGVALLAFCLALGMRAYLQASAEWRGPLLAALLGILALIVHGLVDNSYFLPDLSVLCWLSVAIIALWYRARMTDHHGATEGTASDSSAR